MKDSFFEMLFNLFEKTLVRLKENQEATAKEDINEEIVDEYSSLFSMEQNGVKIDLFKRANMGSYRVLTLSERAKMTKASYQFLMRMLQWQIITPETFEVIITQLMLSESRYVSLNETKWIIRNTLEDVLDDNELAFLDLVLYQKEDRHQLH